MAKTSLHASGFTIIELMMTLAVAAILATIAAPSFSDIIKNNRLSSQYNELLTHITLARSEAVKRGTDIKVLNNNGANSVIWDAGWVVYQDVDDDDTVDSDEAILVSNSPSANITVRFNNNGQITYQANGLGITAGTFTICDDRTDEEAKGLIINATGRVRVATDGNGDNIVDLGSGATNLSCP
jgi:type IV fimbrial biogenesis protein FimT